ncbi:HNH endonuclease signature motif containing protein [Sporichthya sp.]|uniref:HNH endonuclease signature motif containing protein n=1 Tax=Sporichthya sp. TaxID=65475 RepID=UPI0017F3FB1D|nr:HNH endonuclease signature motif containing protein [Sporichthya sp.]MBA3742148.1 DUF222 domain-containing protein [Sporichthya sp.]
MGGDLIEAYAAMKAATSAFTTLLNESAWQLSDGEVAGMTRGHHVVEAQQTAASLRLLSEVESRSIPTTVGAPNLRAWLIRILHMSPQLAGERIRMMQRLSEQCRDTGAAFTAGTVSYEQARAITGVVAGLPKKASFQAKADAETFLLAQSGTFNAHDLRRMGKRIDACIDPDGTLDREEIARERRGCNIRDNHDGTQTLSWRDTDENIALVKAAMSAISAPQPGPDGAKDPRVPQVRRADAMLDLIAQALRKGRGPRARGERPRLVITATAETLRTGAGFGTTASGEELSGHALQRIACDADLIAVIMTKDKAPLEMGRRVRTVTPSQWIALVARDTGCQFHDCTRPAEFCIAHHFPSWAEGGRTDVDKMGLFCEHHHVVIHRDGWDVELGPDRRPQLRPPTWIDPERNFLTNTYWRTQRAMKGALDPDVPGRD